MRPPYGATSSRLNKRLNEQYGLKVILWSVDPLDWKYRNSDRVYNSIIQNTQPGSIILAHDIHATTVAAMPATLDALLGKGLQICDGFGADCDGSPASAGQEGPRGGDGASAVDSGGGPAADGPRQWGHRLEQSKLSDGGVLGLRSRSKPSRGLPGAKSHR